MACAEEALRSTDAKANFQRLTRLLMQGGGTLLRERFDSIHPPATLHTTLRDPAIQTKLRSGRPTRKEWKCLYPSTGVYGKSKDFDITLTFRLLRTISGLTEPATGWDELPNSTDYSLEADLARVKYYRNEVYGHSRDMEISDAEFVDLWREIEEALLRIAASISHEKRDEWKASIDRLLLGPLTPHEEICVEELRCWYKRDMDVKDELEKIYSRLDGIIMRLDRQRERQVQQSEQQIDSRSFGFHGNHPVSEDDIHEKRLADDIGPVRWKDLARALKIFTHADIKAIEKENENSVKECCIEVLVRWLQRKGTDATVRELTGALREIGLKNLADRFLIKESDPNQVDKIEELCQRLVNLVREQDSNASAKVKRLEDEVLKLSTENQELKKEVSRLSARNRELEDASQQEQRDLENNLSLDDDASDVSMDMDQEAREHHMDKTLTNLREQLKTYVTSPLEVPEVKQDQFKTSIKLDLLVRLSEQLQGVYTATLGMVAETCKCSEDLKRDFYDFAYHGLRADHNELLHRVEDLKNSLPEMSEEEKEDYKKLKQCQVNRERQDKALEKTWRALFRPPERLPKATRSDVAGSKENLTEDPNKISRHSDPGARPKQPKPRVEATNSDHETPKYVASKEDKPLNVGKARCIKRRLFRKE